MTTLAVLLIIGSAVVGPIEAQITAYDTDAWKSENKECYTSTRKATDMVVPSYTIADNCRARIQKQWEFEGRLKTESLPELCERVMSGVGIDVEMKSGFVSYAEIMRGGTMLYAVGAFRPANAGDDWHVRCIPVPTGYRR